jgi:hypothetical protein
MAFLYTFTVTNSGDPTTATGLSPVFDFYSDAATNTALAVPTITEIGSGHYKFSVDWDTAPESTAPTDSIAFTIDCDPATAVGLAANERYINGRINRSDNFGSSIDTVLEVTLGKWEIDSNQLKLYQQDGTTLVKTFNLFDQGGSPTSTLPARREPV